jgi:hypothetical protein
MLGFTSQRCQFAACPLDGGAAADDGDKGAEGGAAGAGRHHWGLVTTSSSRPSPTMSAIIASGDSWVALRAAAA